MEFDYSYDTITPSLSTNLTIGGTGSLTVPAGNTSQTPTGVAGSIRYDTTTGKIRFFTTAWGNVATESWTTGAFQPLDADLTSVAALSSTGFAVRTSPNTWAQRSITVGSPKLTVSNADGVSDNPSFDVSEANLTLNNIGGTLSISKGGTGQITANTALNALLPSQSGNSGKALVTDGTNTTWVARSTFYTSSGTFVPKVFIGTATTASDGTWSVNTSAAGFTTVISAMASCVSLGTGVQNQPWTSVSNLTTTNVSGTALRGTGVLIGGNTAQASGSTTIYVHVIGT